MRRRVIAFPSQTLIATRFWSGIFDSLLTVRGIWTSCNNLTTLTIVHSIARAAVEVGRWELEATGCQNPCKPSGRSLWLAGRAELHLDRPCAWRTLSLADPFLACRRPL
jgi:hypothetical protein